MLLSLASEVILTESWLRLFTVYYTFNATMNIPGLSFGVTLVVHLLPARQKERL